MNVIIITVLSVTVFVLSVWVLELRQKLRNIILRDELEITRLSEDLKAAGVDAPSPAEAMREFAEQVNVMTQHIEEFNALLKK